jgi:protein-tyrosine-phosphatase
MSTHTRILFVCLHGAAKSVLAATDCQRLAVERGLDVTADFAGTEPDAAVAPGVVRALLTEGIDLTDRRPRKVTRGDTAAVSRVVAFGCDLSHVAAPGVPIEQWTDVPPVSHDLPVARAVIRQHLERLLDECAAGGPRR